MGIRSSAASSRLLAREAAKARTARRLDLLRTFPRCRQADVLLIQSRLEQNQIQEARRCLAEAQNSLGALQKAGHVLYELIEHLGRIGKIVTGHNTATQSDLEAGLKRLQESLLDAKYEGKNLLDGTEFPVSLPGGKVIKAAIGGAKLYNLAEFLAHGGDGIKGISLASPQDSVGALQHAITLVSMALNQVSTQIEQIGRVTDSLEGQLDEAMRNYPNLDEPLAGAKNCAVAIQKSPHATTSSQAVLNLILTRKLLVD